MAESQFMPAAPPGHSVDAAISGIESGQSMMQRASNLRQSKQMEEMRQQQLDQLKVMMPVIQAKQQADTATAAAALSISQRQQVLRTQAGVAGPLANSEFLEATSLADWNTQSFELARLQAKYAWMGNLPEYKPFLDAIDKARANAVTRAVTDQTLEARMEMAQTAADAGVQKVEAQQAGATERTAMTADSGVKRAEIGADARKATGTQSTDITDRMEFRAAQQSAIQADKDASKASAAGDEANALIYRKHAQEFRDAAKKAITKSEPTSFNVPNVTDKTASAVAPEDTPATETEKLYVPPEHPGEVPNFAPSVKTPEDVISAMQQMVNDGVIDAAQARETLQKLGFKKKGG